MDFDENVHLGYWNTLNNRYTISPRTLEQSRAVAILTVRKVVHGRVWQDQTGRRRVDSPLCILSELNASFCDFTVVWQRRLSTYRTIEDDKVEGQMPGGTPP